MIETIAKCSHCGYPITAEYEGQVATCAYCGTVNEAIAQGVTIPTGLFWFGAGVALGIIFGPAIIASTDSGAQRLAKMAKEKLTKK